MRRAVAILLKFNRTTGHLHPHLPTVFGNYHSLVEMSFSADRLVQQLLKLLADAGFDAQESQNFLNKLVESES
jgi:hypothetical protein